MGELAEWSRAELTQRVRELDEAITAVRAERDAFATALRRVMNQNFWDPEMGIEDVIAIAEEALGETSTRPKGPPG